MTKAKALKALASPGIDPARSCLRKLFDFDPLAPSESKILALSQLASILPLPGLSDIDPSFLSKSAAFACRRDLAKAERVISNACIDAQPAPASAALSCFGIIQIHLWAH